MVEILKLGKIIGRVSSLKDIGGTNYTPKYTVLLVSDEKDDIFEFYKNIFLGDSSEYDILDTTRNIVGYSNSFLRSYTSTTVNNISGYMSDTQTSIILGSPFTIYSSPDSTMPVWRTSNVLKVIENCVIITMNSVYAIHDISKLRNYRLEKLGI